MLIRNTGLHFMRYLLLLLLLSFNAAAFSNYDSLLVFNPAKAYHTAKIAFAKTPHTKFIAIMVEANLNLGNYEKADSIYKEYRPLYSSVDIDSLQLMEIKRHMARIYTIRFRFQEALALFNEVLAYHFRHENNNLLVQTKVNLAEYHRILVQPKEGEELLLGAIEAPYFEEEVSSAVKANLYHRLAALVRQYQESELSAIKYLEQSLSYSEPLQHLDHMATAYTELGDIYRSIHDDRALKFLEKSIIMWEKLGYPAYVGGANLVMARYMADQGNPEMGLQYISKVLQVAQKHGLQPMLYDGIETKAQLLFRQGKYKEAFILRDSSANFNANMQKSQYDKDILQVTKQLQTDLAEAELAFSKQREELAKKEAEQEKRLRKASMWGVFISAISIAIILFFQTRLKKEKAAISEKNKIIEIQNEKLNKSLAEKDILIREVHHRVKNNLQMIISIIEMQLMRSEPRLDKQADFETLLGRVATMALVHEQLYAQSEMAQLQVKPYIENLINHLSKLRLTEDYKLLQVQLDIASISEDISRCIALGMIINELFTNSLKHAFSGQLAEAKIYLRLGPTKEFGKLQFTYQDNGPGIEPGQQRGFGVRLIELFSKQLKGSFTESKNNVDGGYMFNLVFSQGGT